LLRSRPIVRALVALVAGLTFLASAPAARAGQRTYSRAQVDQIMGIIDDAVAARQAKQQRRADATARKKRVRSLKMAAALRMAADYKADKARKAEEAARPKRERAAARARLLQLLTGR
jgi:hypothetical protein